MSAYITQEGLQAIARELSSRYGQSPQRLSDGGYQVNCPLHDDGHPSCSLHVRDDGKLLARCHAGCSQDIVYAKIKELYPQYFGNGKKTLTWQIAWEKNSRPADTETLQRYFMDGRGIPLSKAVLNILKKTLKINEYKGTFSLLAPISKSPGNAPTGTLQTYLKKDGSRYVKAKSTQFTDGSKAKGSAYWIDTGSNTLVIAEGLETGLSFLSVVPGISLAVVGSASILPTLDIPNRFTEVNILVDCDLQDKTGQRAAIKAARRYQKAGKSVYLVTPTRDTFSEKPAKKKDFNDLSPTEIMETWQARETLAEVLERYRPGDVVKGGVEISSKPSIAEKYQYVLNEYPIMDFPWDVLPDGMVACIQKVAAIKGVVPQMLVSPVMATVASLLAPWVEFRIREGHYPPLIFFFCDVAPSGSGKTHAQRALVTEYLKEWQWELNTKASEALKEWNQLPKKERLQTEKPPEEISLYLTGGTTEGIRDALRVHPSTVLLVNEASSIITGQNQYKGGNGDDREFFLRLYDGGRRGEDPRTARAGEVLTAKSPYVSIAGNTQESTWGTLLKQNKLLQEDGTLYRFLFLHERNPAVPLDPQLKLDNETEQVWKSFMSNLWRCAEERLRPIFDNTAVYSKSFDKSLIRLTANEEAERYFIENLANPLRLGEKELLPSELQGFAPKCSEYAARFSGLLKLTEQLWYNGDICDETITPDDVKKGEKLARFYLAHNLHLTLSVLQEIKPAAGLPPSARRLAQVLESVRPDVRNGVYPVKILLEKYNSISGPSGKLNSSNAMKRLMEKHGFQTVRGNYGELKKYTLLQWDEEKITNFLKETATSATSATTLENTGVAGVAVKNPIATSATLNKKEGGKGGSGGNNCHPHEAANHADCGKGGKGGGISEVNKQAEEDDGYVDSLLNSDPGIEPEEEGYIGF